jgi:glycosyltransferase involved in cell wall biosynthesis
LPIGTQQKFRQSIETFTVTCLTLLEMAKTTSSDHANVSFSESRQLSNDLATQPKCIALLFDLSSGGHHVNFIKYLVYYWSETHPSAELHIVVAPDFLDRHPELVALSYTTNFSKIQFTAISIDEFSQVKRQKSLIRQSWAEWAVFCQYASKLKATQAVLMYMDTFQIPLALVSKVPCQISGIYFRPAFHYGRFATYQPTWGDRVREWRQKLLLAQILRHPQFKTLFSMDPFAVPVIEQFKGRTNVLPLEDPISLHQPDPSVVEELRLNLSIESNRRVFLLFGKISHRKGVLQVLEAIQRLSPTMSQRVCLLVVGCIDTNDRPQIQAKLAELSDCPAQIIVYDRYFTDLEVQAYLEIADIVLAPYQRHVGTSSIMLQAAAAQKPVLASNYGLMGEFVRQHELGLAIDASNVQQLSQGIVACLGTDAKIGNSEKMKEFADQNLWQKYAKTIITEITH